MLLQAELQVARLVPFQLWGVSFNEDANAETSNEKFSQYIIFTAASVFSVS